MGDHAIWPEKGRALAQYWSEIALQVLCGLSLQWSKIHSRPVSKSEQDRVIPRTESWQVWTLLSTVICHVASVCRGQTDHWLRWWDLVDTKVEQRMTWVGETVPTILAECHELSLISLVLWLRWPNIRQSLLLAQWYILVNLLFSFVVSRYGLVTLGECQTKLSLTGTGPQSHFSNCLSHGHNKKQ